MEYTLKSLAIAYAQGKLTREEVKAELPNIEPVRYVRESERATDLGEYYYEGNPFNVIDAVRARVGLELTMEQYLDFESIIMEHEGIKFD